MDPVVLTGQMVITDGAVFSAELTNCSSVQFKSLAFDVQQLVRTQHLYTQEKLLF